jgi:hypothetical protein
MECTLSVMMSDRLEEWDRQEPSRPIGRCGRKSARGYQLTMSLCSAVDEHCISSNFHMRSTYLLLIYQRGALDKTASRNHFLIHPLSRRLKFQTG